jgi:hypothetical protein
MPAGMAQGMAAEAAAEAAAAEAASDRLRFACSLRASGVADLSWQVGQRGGYRGKERAKGALRFVPLY